MHTPFSSRSVVALAAALVVPGVARAAFEVRSVPSTPITFDPAGSSIVDFSVAGHNPALGTLQSVGYRLGIESGVGTIDWTVHNPGPGTVDGDVTVTQSTSLTVQPGGNVVTGFISFAHSPDFSLPAGQDYVFQQSGFLSGSSGGSDSTPAFVAPFNTAGNVNLRLETSISASVPVGTNVSSATGSIVADASVLITYKYDAIAAPSATPISVGSSATGTFSHPDVAWFQLAYAGGDLTIDTLGSFIEADGSNDTMIGLYTSLGDLVQFNDDGDGFSGDDQYLSRLHFAAGALSPGTYYIALSGYGVDFEFDTENFNADPTGLTTLSGNYRLNVNNAVPEPAALSVLALSTIPLLTRRRR